MEQVRRGAAPARAWGRIALLVGCVSSCEGSASEPPAPHHELGGTYGGTLTGASDDGTLDGVLVVTVEREGGDLAGTFFIQGTVTFGDLSAAITGTGTHTGEVFPGNPAPLYLELHNPVCPDHPGELGGRFYAETGVLELGGAIDVLDPGCSLLASYQSWAYLTL